MHKNEIKKSAKEQNLCAYLHITLVNGRSTNQPPQWVCSVAQWSATS